MYTRILTIKLLCYLLSKIGPLPFNLDTDFYLNYGSAQKRNSYKITCLHVYSKKAFDLKCARNVA